MPPTTDERRDASDLREVSLLGLGLAVADAQLVTRYVFDRIDAGKGGMLVTANLDFLRRYVVDEEARAIYAAADLRVADGMPLVWASVLAGDPLPERVAGSSLIYDLVGEAARRRRRVYFLGGDEGAAAAAAAELKRRFPEFEVAGVSAPRVAYPPTDAQVDAIAEELKAATPDLILVGLGSPKQEALNLALRSRFPRAWLVGVGISFSFVAGAVRRAPPWMRTAGLEWVHRLSQEPRRLARRYLVDDLPFSVRLFGWAVRARVRRARSRDATTHA